MSAPDVVIVGAGPVGAAFALAVSGAGLSAALVEASAGPDPDVSPRPIALSYGSSLILRGLGLWAALAPRVAPIRVVHASQRGHFGVTRLRAQDHGVEALGYVCDSRVLAEVFEHALSSTQVEQVRPARVRVHGVEAHADRIRVPIARAAQGGEFEVRAARLLVAADGGHSSVRRAMGIESRARDYRQLALTATLTIERDHHGIAYERFTDDGPIAALPMPGRRCALIWTLPSERGDAVLAMDDGEFMHELMVRFGSRLGPVTHVGPRTGQPLQLIRAREQVRERAVVIGNAAHTLHPVAGQGLNLGLRDAATLAEVVVDAWRNCADPGAPDVLARYLRWRRRDQLAVTMFTDALARGFVARFVPLAMARAAAMLALDLIPAANRALTRRAMGLGGRQSRLARGLAL